MLGFLVEAVLISLSGVMAPGPMTAVAVGRGSKSPLAGAWVAVGHGLVEVPLMVAVFYGLGRLLQRPYVRSAIGLAGAVFLVVMAVGLLRTARRTVLEGAADGRSPVLAGVLLSVGNPYFLIWWATVGAALVLRAVQYGVIGFAAFAAGHWLCDLLWCSFLSGLSYKGGQFFGGRFQRLVFTACGVLLLFFAGKLLWEAALAVAR